MQTYLERDVRAVALIRDLATFRRFIGLLATRHGKLLNRTDVAAPLGVSVPTVSHWISILETTAQILLVPPFYENLGKRLVKSPKVYIADSGLACHLLGIATAAELVRSPFHGALFEGFIAAEMVKAQVNEQGQPNGYSGDGPGRAGQPGHVRCASRGMPCRGRISWHSTSARERFRRTPIAGAGRRSIISSWRGGLTTATLAKSLRDVFP